jgi:hypothetical protein
MTQVDITAREVNDGVLRLPLVLSVTPREDVAVGRVDQMADPITSDPLVASTDLPSSSGYASTAVQATENTSHFIECLGRRHIRPPPPAAPRLARSWTRPTHEFLRDEN